MRLAQPAKPTQRGWRPASSGIRLNRSAQTAASALGDLGVYLPADHGASSSSSRLGELTLTLVGPSGSVELALGRALQRARIAGSANAGTATSTRRSGSSQSQEAVAADQHGLQHADSSALDSQAGQTAHQSLAARPKLQGGSGGEGQAGADTAASVQPSSSGRAYMSPSEKRQLTIQITNCSSWHQLATLVHMHDEQLDHVHLSAAIVKLAKLLPSPHANPEPQLFHLVSHLCGRVPDMIHLLDDRQTANMLWALAVATPTLTRPAQQGRTGKIAAAATVAAAAAARQAHRLSLKMQQFWDTASPQALSNALWALATLGIRPADHWLRGYVAATRQLLGSFRPQELSSMLWALATLRIWPGREWLGACTSACSAGLTGYGPQALANTLWALVKLQAPLPPGFVAQLAGACLKQLDGSRVAGAEQAGPAAATPGHGTRARARTVAGRGRRVGPRQALEPCQIGMILWALATWRRRQGQPGTEAGTGSGSGFSGSDGEEGSSAGQVARGAATAPVTAITGAATGVAGGAQAAAAAGGTVAALGSQAAAVAGMATPTGASQVAAVAVAGMMKAAAGLATAAKPNLGGLPTIPQQSVPLPRGGVQGGAMPQGPVSGDAAAAGAAAPQAAAAAPALAAATVAAKAELREADGLAAWALADALVQHTQGQLSALPSRSLVLMAWALAQLDYVPRAAWQQQLMHSVAQQARELNAPGLCQLLWALAK